MNPYFFSGLILLAFPQTTDHSLLFAALEAPTVQPHGKPPSPTLHYVSDYVSFLGRDALGHVAFALDTNRGRDGDHWQAEHFVVLHDERHGWVDLAGNGSYDNTARELFGIPNSPVFTFEGSPTTGLTVTSTPNALTLAILPLSRRLSRKQDGGAYWMSSAQATLVWGERTLPGRVIYEYLSKPDFNRLTRTYWGLWDNFQGFYLSVGQAGDFYLHRSDSKMLAALIGEQEAFAVLDSNELALGYPEITVRDRAFAPGFYRWPMTWTIRSNGKEGSIVLQLETLQFRRMANWVIGGFAMSIVQGELLFEGQSYPVYGFAELLT